MSLKVTTELFSFKAGTYKSRYNVLKRPMKNPFYLKSVKLNIFTKILTEFHENIIKTFLVKSAHENLYFYFCDNGRRFSTS